MAVEMAAISGDDEVAVVNWLLETPEGELRELAVAAKVLES